MVAAYINRWPDPIYDPCISIPILDWVLMSRSAVPAGHMEMTQVRLDELIGQELKRQLEKKNAKEALLNLDIDQIYDEKMNRQLEAAFKLSFILTERTQKLYTQMSVSELKKQSQIGREEDNIGTGAGRPVSFISCLRKENGTGRRTG